MGKRVVDHRQTISWVELDSGAFYARSWTNEQMKDDPLSTNDSPIECYWGNEGGGENDEWEEGKRDEEDDDDYKMMTNRRGMEAKVKKKRT